MSLITSMTTPRSAIPKSAIPLDFEQQTWKEAIDAFKMTSGHDPDKLDSFTKLAASPQTVQQTCQEKRNEASSQYGKILGNILGKIDIFINAGNLAVKAAPESVGLAWTGISLALGAVQDDFATFQLFSGACMDIIGILISCRVCARMFATPSGPPEFLEIQEKVKESIPKVYTGILEFSYQMSKHMERNKGYRILRGTLKPYKTEFEERIKTIKNGERTMGEYASKASQALSLYFQKRADMKGDLLLQNDTRMLEDLKEIRKILDTSAATSKELMDYVKKELEEQKKRTPMDVAQDTFNKYKIQLNAVADQEPMFQKRRDTLLENGTCKWIFEDTSEYDAWQNSSGSSLLWVSGGGNMGKSFLVASIIDKLKEETANRADESSHYFFCKNGDDNAQKTERILDHIYYYLYKLAPQSLEVLDTCNEITRQYLASRIPIKGSSKTPEKDQEVEKSLSFEDAYAKLAETLKRKIYLIIDALDECSDRQSEELIKRIRALTQRSDLKIKVIVSSRPETDIADAIGNDVPRLRMEKWNEMDIKKTVIAELAKIPGLSPAEREEAMEMITSRAGPYFGYVNPALELLRKPWQRPLKQHLQQLPDDLLNMNARIFQSTDPSYIEFLKLCLSWVILANGNQKVKIDEIVDAYSRVFTAADSDWSGEEVVSEAHIDFYKTQIRKAGDTFLEVDDKTKEISLIKPALVKDSFLKAHSKTSQPEEDLNECQCKECKSRRVLQRPFVLTEKNGHLEIARTIFSHLNSIVFCKKYLPSDHYDLFAKFQASVKAGETDKSYPEWLASYNSSHSEEHDTTVDDDKDEVEEKGVAEEMTDSVIEEGQKTMIEETSTSFGKISLNTDLESLEQVEETPTKHQLDEPRDTKEESAMEVEAPNTDSVEVPPRDTSLGVESLLEVPLQPAPVVDTDDNESDLDSEADSDFPTDSGPLEAVTDGQTGMIKSYRYEISQCLYHLQMVENLWKNEKDKPEEYEELWADVLAFFNIHHPAFIAFAHADIKRSASPWETYDAWYEGKPLSPLHFAAAYGLIELSRRLIERGDPVMSWTESGLIPLHYAAKLPDNHSSKLEVCQLLLDNGSLMNLNAMKQPSAEGEEDKVHHWETPFHALVYSTQDKSIVKLFLEHGEGARCDEVDAWGYTVTHNFAYTGTDPNVLDMLVAKGADINKGDTNTKEGPLHKLVTRDDLPLAVLERFIFHGALVNAEDAKSEQPLYEVAYGGNLEAVKILLKHNADVHDEDNNGATALHNAALLGREDICRALVENAIPAEPTRLDKSGASPFWNACSNGDIGTSKYLAQVLKKRDPTLLDRATDTGKTPLRKAVAGGHVEVVRMILEEYDVNLNSTDMKFKRTPLHVAAYKGNSAIVRLLLEHKADTEAIDIRGHTALMLCYEKWHDARNDEYENCLLEFIKADRAAAVADLNLLSVASVRGSLPVLEALVVGTPKADPVLRDEYGWTAIELAKQYRRHHAVTLLSEHGGAIGKYPAKWDVLASKLASFNQETGELKFVGGDNLRDSVTVLSDHPIPANVSKYYFEISVEFPDPEKAIENNHFVCFGLFQQQSGRRKKTKDLEKCWPGYFNPSITGHLSWAYHGDDGFIVCSSVDYKSETQCRGGLYGHGDTVGCGVDFEKGIIFFTKNGKRLMKAAFDGVNGRLNCVIGLLYPVTVKTTFQAPFKWSYADTLDFDNDPADGYYEDKDKAAVAS